MALSFVLTVDLLANKYVNKYLEYAEHMMEILKSILRIFNFYNYLSL